MNKEYGLMYGCILKQVLSDIDVEILAYKIPHHMHKVNYNHIIEQLWAMLISDDNDEDRYIKKLIVNVVIGLLEKGWATDQKSIPFRRLNEAINYQTEFGGKLNKLREIEIDDEGFEEVKQDCYILNVKDKAELKNGFRFIKELLYKFTI